MAIVIHTDASFKDGKGRGTYVILYKTKSGNSNKVKERIVRRTPTVLVNGPTEMECLTLYQALIHTYKTYPEENEYNVYCDALQVFDKFKVTFKQLFGASGDENIRNTLRVLTDNFTCAMPDINFHHVKAHQNKLGTEAERYNFFCDVLSSVTNK